MGKQNSRKQGILTYILIIAVTFSLTITPVCVEPKEAYAAEVGGKSELKKGDDLSGSQVYFGSSDKAIKWYVVDEDASADNVTLFCTDAGIEEMPYSLKTDEPYHGNWSDSDLCKWLNSTYTGGEEEYTTYGGGFLNERFTIVESDSIDVYGTTDVGSDVRYGDIKIDQKIVVPSFNEIFHESTDKNLSGYWKIGLEKRVEIKPKGWWLRTPEGGNGQIVKSVHGGFFGTQHVTNLETEVLPALKLQLSSLLFTSAAYGDGSKSSSVVNSNLANTQPTTGVLKLTLYDNNLKLSQLRPTAISGDSITLNYTGVTKNHTMSAIVKDVKGNVKNYGRILSDTNENGYTEVNIPSGYAVGNDKLELFVEKINDPQITDYASSPVAIDIQQNTSSPAHAATVDCTNAYNNDGKITNVNSNMEYKVHDDTSWKAITGTSISGLSDGKYDVRYKNKLVNEVVYIDGEVKTLVIKPQVIPTPPKYTVTLNTNGGKTLANNKLTVKKGDEYGKLPTPKRGGYKFKGWYTKKSGGTKIEPDTIVDLTDDQTLYARWTANRYKVTFIGNKGKIRTDDKYKSTKLTKTKTYNNKFGTLPKVKRTGYKFKGWFTKKSGGTEVTSKSKMKYAKNIKLYARWTPNGKIVNCKYVHMRKGPGKSRVVKGYIKKGTKVNILSKTNVRSRHIWYKVKVGKRAGYIYSQYVKYM